MKKAIVAVPYLKGTGGTETVIKNFAEALNVKQTNDGIKWKLISFGGSNGSSWLDGWDKKVYNFSKSRYMQLAGYATCMPILIASTLKKEKPNFFIATNPIIWNFAYKLKKIFSPNTKIIAWYHYSFKMKNIKTKYLKNTDEFWAISKGIKKELVSMGVKESKITIVYNPINITKPKKVKRTGRQNRFVYIGRIDYDGQKNVSELIKALNLVEGNWKCDLYGSVDDKIKTKLLKPANKNVQEKISFKGFSENVWDKIHEADILLLTSKYEGFGMVLCEAAIRGISLISSSCPMGPDEIINSENGFLYKPGNVKELSSLIKDIVSQKSILPNSDQVIDSVKKFGYRSFSKRILLSLRNNIN